MLPSPWLSRGTGQHFLPPIPKDGTNRKLKYRNEQIQKILRDAFISIHKTAVATSTTSLFIRLPFIFLHFSLKYPRPGNPGARAIEHALARQSLGHRQMQHNLRPSKLGTLVAPTTKMRNDTRHVIQSWDQLERPSEGNNAPFYLLYSIYISTGMCQVCPRLLPTHVRAP